MVPKRLPIGIQSFSRLREANCYYVDKTPLIEELISRSDHCFLSRPRRFGKSLLVDTIGMLFAGQEALFRGMAIHDHWDWSVAHPVLRLSFGGKYTEPDDVDGDIIEQLESVEREYDLAPATASSTGPRRLRNLLDRLHHKTGQRVVILVDEYDKPILDVLDNPDLATANRDYLRGFYGIIKDSAVHVRFVFVTGVSMFSKVSLFSGLNNLEDISLDPRYSAICGYTDDELDAVFAPELEGLDRDEIRTWYNGYCWRGGERVYNPHDVLLLLRHREFRPYWFETGSPTFLFETLKAKSVGSLELEGRVADRALVSKFDVDDISVEALLFQTGYLTISDERRDGFDTLYRLEYPNLEVRISLSRGLLADLGAGGPAAFQQSRTFCEHLEENNFSGFGKNLRAWLSGIPYQWHAVGDLARYESWYASLLYMSLLAAGADVRAEEPSSHGRADMVVRLGGQIFIFEFKMARNADDAGNTLDAAMTQMRERGYAGKYHGTPVHLIGVACGREARNLLTIRSETAMTRQIGR